MSPPPSDSHSWQVRVLDRSLTAVAPEDVYILQNVGVHLGPHGLAVPDLVVVSQDAPFHDDGYDPAGVLLVVEVASASPDRRAWYAEQGVQYYWRVDDGPILRTFRLDLTADHYESTAELGPHSRADLEAPWPVTVDTAELVMPHRR